MINSTELFHFSKKTGRYSVYLNMTKGHGEINEINEITG